MLAGVLYSVRKFSFCKIYTVFVGNLFYRLAHKKIPYAVCWKASKTYKTLISKRRTLVDIAIRKECSKMFEQRPHTAVDAKHMCANVMRSNSPKNKENISEQTSRLSIHYCNWTVYPCQRILIFCTEIAYTTASVNHNLF